MIHKEMQKHEIEKELEKKGEFVQIDYLTRFLEDRPPINLRKFAYEKLSKLYENRGFFNDAAKMAENIGVNTVSLSEQIKHYTEATRLFIKGGDFERADKAMKKAIAESNSRQKEQIYKEVKNIYLKQGETYEKKKKIKDAVKVYEKILEMNLPTEEREVYKNKLLNLYEKLGDVKKYFIMKDKK